MSLKGHDVIHRHGREAGETFERQAGVYGARETVLADAGLGSSPKVRGLAWGLSGLKSVCKLQLSTPFWGDGGQLSVSLGGTGPKQRLKNLVLG